MILSESHNFLFVHIPKNGGTSVETLLMRHLDAEKDLHISEIAEIADNRARFGVKPGALLRKHSTLPKLMNILGAAQVRQRFSFSFSRNPYSRAFSAFNFVVSVAKNEARAIERGRPAKNDNDRQREWRKRFLTISFDEVCRNLPEIADLHGLFRPQCYWLPAVDSVDYVGRLENLSEDMRLIFERTGLPLDDLSALTVANQKTAPGSWRKMTADSAAAIRDFYAVDFERFGYGLDFDGPDTAPPPSAVAGRAEVVVEGPRARANWAAYQGAKGITPVVAPERKRKSDPAMATPAQLAKRALRRAERMREKADQLIKGSTDGPKNGA